METLRNIAIIAHVDHGKTTLVDKLLIQCKLFDKHQNPGELILDNNDLERERGITILSKNISVRYKNHKINIIDTPGHADFGGEVERVLNMTDGVLLLVDAFEGPMPQTRFVLQKALLLGLKPILVINKVDKPNCRPEEIQEMVFELMFSLDASEEQLDFPVVFGSSKEGWMSDDWQKRTNDLSVLLDCIIKHIPPVQKIQGNAKMLITSLDYSNFVGRIAIGRVYSGEFYERMPINIIKRNNTIIKTKIKELYIFEGLERKKVEKVESGEICAMIGLENFDISDTVSNIDDIEALPSIAIDEPTMSMIFTINDSPFFGQDGKYVTSRHIKERLDKELEKNLALRVEEAQSPDKFIVYGRGVLHLSVLIETMRREGYELQVGQPKVIIKNIGGEKCEPIEDLTVNVPEEFSGKIIEIVTQRKGEIIEMVKNDDRVTLIFKIPSRGIIGIRNNMLTMSNGEAIIAHRFIEYQPYKGKIEKRLNGSLIAMESGNAFAYSLDKLQDRGRFFIAPNEKIYEGQVVGENNRADDLVVNITKSKKLTNMRAAGSDDKTRLAPPIKFSLEEAMEYIKEDEYLEVTPAIFRFRKILLKEIDRKRARNSSNE